MSKNIDNILFFLEGIKDVSSSKRVEYNLIKRYKNQKEWDNLAPNEKQSKRRENLKSLKKYYEEDGLRTYDFENAVIEFYDLANSLYEELKYSETNSMLNERLKLLINIDLETINFKSYYLDLKVTPHFIYDEILSHYIDDKTSEYLKLIDYCKTINNRK